MIRPPYFLSSWLLVAVLFVGTSCEPTNPPEEPPVDATFGVDVERADVGADGEGAKRQTGDGGS